jgi:GNAT superfamily N-acetyltransferase
MGRISGVICLSNLFNMSRMTRLWAPRWSLMHHAYPEHDHVASRHCATTLQPWQPETILTEVLDIRPVLRADFARWLPLWDGYNKFYGRSGPTALAPAITTVTWDRFIDENEPMYALVAERNGMLVGLAHYLFHRSTIMSAPTCYLADLFTTEAARGQGVGRMLINAVYQRASDAGCGRVYWQTHETNFTARKLYDGVADQSGFIVYKKVL